MNGNNTSDNRTRRPATPLVVGLLGAVLLLAGTAGAGWFDRDKTDRDDGQALPAHRFDYHPTVSFRQGTLQRDAMGGWRLDDIALHLTKGCLVTQEDASTGALEEGRHALVAGAVLGNTILASNIKMQGWYEESESNPGNQADKRPSEVDPTVGVLEGGPR